MKRTGMIITVALCLVTAITALAWDLVGPTASDRIAVTTTATRTVLRDTLGSAVNMMCEVRSVDTAFYAVLLSYNKDSATWRGVTDTVYVDINVIQPLYNRAHAVETWTASGSGNLSYEVYLAN